MFFSVAPSLIRTLERRATRENLLALQSYLQPQQLAMSPAGAHRLVYMVRMVMEKNPGWVSCKVDVENGHSSISRAGLEMGWCRASPAAWPTSVWGSSRSCGRWTGS